MKTKTWTNELQTNKGKASIRLFYSEHYRQWIALVNSTERKAPEYLKISENEPDMFQTAKAEAREIFKQVVTEI
jgi:hypothetical protein